MTALVIFDCDGVLFDSAGANVAYYNAVLARLGRPPLDEAWGRRAHFLSSRQLYEAMFGADSELGAAALRVGAEVDYGPFYALMRPMPGLERVLQQLAPHYRLALATNRGGTAHGVVRHFGLDRWLSLAVGANDVARAKPHPDMLLHCLQHFRLPPTAAVYVGDSDTDHQAARAAGIRFVAFGAALPAAQRIHALAELPDLLAASRPLTDDP
jgi:HAD superfamily hydrolase (TIGR01509 family)